MKGRTFFLSATLAVILLTDIEKAVSQNVAITNDATFTTPQSILHIYRNANGSLFQLSNPTTTAGANRGLYFTATGNDFSLINNEAGFLNFYTSNTERMRILSTGNVGIGITAPAYRLDVYGPAGNYPARVGSPDGYLTFGPANSGWSHFATDRPRFYFNTGVTVDGGLIGSYDEDLSLQTQGTTRITVLNSNGNTGIGTVTPAYRLDLASGTFGYGNSNQRTETRNDAGLQGSAGAQSGMFETSAPAPAADWPAGAASWWHLLDIRHSNPANNYAMQFAGSFFDQNLYFRKTNNNPAQAWSQILTTSSGVTNSCGTVNYLPKMTTATNIGCSQVFDNGTNVGIGTAAPSYKLHVTGDIYANGGWLRTSGNAGWYSESYGGGWLMTDATWIRSYNSKNVYCDQVIRADAGFQVDGNQVIDGDAGWHRTWGNTGWYSSTWNGGLYMSDADYVRTYAPSDITGIDVNGPINVGGWNATYRVNVGWYIGGDPLVAPTTDYWGYVGAYWNPNFVAWYEMNSYDYWNISKREEKHDIYSINDDDALTALVLEDIDKIKPSFYRYNKEKDFFDGSDTKYRPQMHLGVISDESPDYILGQTYDKVNIYGIATMSLVGVKQNRKEIKEIKDFLNVNGESITVHDFGTKILNGTEVWVSFSDEFSEKITNSNIPVITVTSNNSTVQLSVVEKNPDGFKVQSNSNVSDLTFDWIAITKTQTNFSKSQNVSHTSQIPVSLYDRLRVPVSTKNTMLEFYKNIKIDNKSTISK